MKQTRRLVVSVSLATVLMGCRPQEPVDQAPPPLANAGATAPRPAPGVEPMAPSAPLARFDGQVITFQQLYEPLLQAHGLDMLIQLAQMEMARRQTEQRGVTVSEEDFAAEKRLTLERLFESAGPGENKDVLLAQFLRQQNISEPEFELVLRTNTYLRAIALAQLEGQITEEALQDYFAAEYGETAQARHIQLANLAEVNEARRRLAGGEPFEAVARALSRNARTAALGGELPQFSRRTTSVPVGMREIAFSLKPGEISDPVIIEGSYHLVRLERFNAPKAVRYEDVKDAVRESFEQRLLDAAVRQLRAELTQRLRTGLRIDDPTLRKQFEEGIAQAQTQIRDREQIRQELQRQREALQSQTDATTQPSPDAPSATAPAPVTAPATSPSVLPEPAPQPEQSPAPATAPAP